MTDDLIEFLRFLRARLDEDERVALVASHVLRDGAHWSLDEWQGRDVPHSLIAQGTAEQPVAIGHFTADPVPTEQAAHIARHDPARVLREVGAKRRMLELHGPVMLRRRVGDQMADVAACAYDTDPDGMGWIDFPCTTLRLLALPYADHPDYREEWRP